MGSATWRTDGPQISDGCETGEDCGHIGFCSPLIIVMMMIIIVLMHIYSGSALRLYFTVIVLEGPQLQ